MNGEFYLQDFKGIAAASAVKLEPGREVRLPSQPCKLAKIHRWNVDSAGGFSLDAVGVDVVDSNREVYYGFGGVICGQLFASQSTELLPINNLNQIKLLLPAKAPAAVTIFFTWFE